MFVITAASGQLGQLIVQELAAQVPADQIAVSVRDPQKVQAFAEQGITVHQADYDHIDSLVAAFTGAEKVVFISGNTPVDVRIKQHLNVVAAAERAGVKQIIYTSLLDAGRDSPFAYTIPNADTEQALRDSTLDWVIVRPGMYAEMTFADAQRALQTGQWVSPVATGRVSYITRHDIARAIVAILVGDGHSQQVYELTGTAAISQSEIAVMLSAISGKPVELHVIDYATYEEGARQMGLPEDMALAFTGLQKAMEENRLSTVTSTVEQLTGQAPKTLADTLQLVLPTLMEA